MSTFDESFFNFLLITFFVMFTLPGLFIWVVLLSEWLPKLFRRLKGDN